MPNSESTEQTISNSSETIKIIRIAPGEGKPPNCNSGQTVPERIKIERSDKRELSGRQERDKPKETDFSVSNADEVEKKISKSLMNRLSRKMNSMKKRELGRYERCVHDCQDDYDYKLDELDRYGSRTTDRSHRRALQREMDECVRQCRNDREEDRQQNCESLKQDGYDGCDREFDDLQTLRYLEQDSPSRFSDSDTRSPSIKRQRQMDRLDHRQCLDGVDELFDECVFS
ncbi:uncharacterized protein MONOS_1115 [Monocercomonoides exilis]|uniref:uncharacterized protein n=1 Tax=Monocercomonoides exilis TaxID=2049356 RepID=UPI003559BC6A|nr:hypothetical protein MONOS_1115 [Monocercomonoides exilis]|eukprot:MONOS_1115.1-p1 / transcript=MONOS_1115.1 / gene=MONOS_1115 / organism=Monocercomonoides_exilis_PA203 / gene_product=unspecified product / transcript_product=unspecified product / location=Mono_scaffold00019:12108-13073(+) / protein_length=230 / sequence_SO=supercontig / SO=protein_coding / is_pseudo=false